MLCPCAHAKAARTARHHMVKRVLGGHIARLGRRVDYEVNLESTVAKRKDGVTGNHFADLVTATQSGDQRIIDVVVADPTAASSAANKRRALTGVKTGVVAQAEADDKVRQYHANYAFPDDVTLVPFALETLGTWGAAAQFLAREMTTTNGTYTLTKDQARVEHKVLVQRVAVALQRGNFRGTLAALHPDDKRLLSREKRKLVRTTTAEGPIGAPSRSTGGTGGPGGGDGSTDGNRDAADAAPQGMATTHAGKGPQQAAAQQQPQRAQAQAPAAAASTTRQTSTVSSAAGAVPNAQACRARTTSRITTRHFWMNMPSQPQPNERAVLAAVAQAEEQAERALPHGSLILDFLRPRPRTHNNAIFPRNTGGAAASGTHSVEANVIANGGSVDTGSGESSDEDNLLKSRIMTARQRDAPHGARGKTSSAWPHTAPLLGAGTGLLETEAEAEEEAEAEADANATLEVVDIGRDVVEERPSTPSSSKTSPPSRCPGQYGLEGDHHRWSQSMSDELNDIDWSAGLRGV